MSCLGDVANGWKCVRGTLYVEDIATGTQKAMGPCKCQTEVQTAKVVQLPGTPAAPVAYVAAGATVITNNVMGHQKMPINAKHEALITRVRDLGLEFYALLHEAGGTDPNKDRMANRRLAIAATELEGVVMWAIKGITNRD